MRSKAGFNVGNGHARREGCEGTAERTRGVSLNDEQVRRIVEQRQHCSGHGADMRVRILPSGTAKFDPAEAMEIELARLERRVLSCEDQCRSQPLRPEGIRDGFELDGLRPGPDDQPYVRKTQLSP
jgi:hypothetical protein